MIFQTSRLVGYVSAPWKTPTASPLGYQAVMPSSRQPFTSAAAAASAASDVCQKCVYM